MVAQNKGREKKKFDGSSEREMAREMVLSFVIIVRLGSMQDGERLGENKKITKTKDSECQMERRKKKACEPSKMEGKGMLLPSFGVVEDEDGRVQPIVLF